MILSALLFKAILVAFLGFLDNWQADACSAPNIREKEGNEIKVIEVTSGKDVKLTCQIRIAGQTSKPRYYWLKDNQTLSPSSHHRLRLKLYRYLKIKRAKKEDTGFYTCVAVNDCGKNHFTMHLFVRTAPRFTVQQGKMSRNLLTVPVGHSVKLDCSAEGNPRPTVKWYKDGNLFKERKSGYRLYWSRWATMLILKGLVPSDAGSYMCNVSNSYGWINHTYKLNVHERTRAEPVVLPMENVTVYRGENASLTCKASSDSMPHFQWLRWFPLRSNGSANSSANSSADDSIETPHYEIMNKEDTDQYVILPPSDGKMFDFHGVKLTLFNVTKRDEGKYTCIVGNAVGYAVEHTYIIVQKMERARAEPVVLPMKNVTVYRGENASLTCKASSDSMPHFQWLRWFPLPSNGSANSSADDSIETPHYEIVNKEDTDQHVILPLNDGKMFDFHGAKLTLFNVTKRDEGKYTCIVGNTFGYAVEHTYIIVQNMAPPSCDLNGLKCSFTPDEFADLNGTHYNDSTEKKTRDVLVSGTVLACVLSTMAALIIICWRRRSRNKRPLLPRSPSELEFEYDAFVIFSSQDSDWVIKTLIPTLEEKHDFKCCVHYRDFVIGVPFRENMVNSVYNSRKTIAVVSKNFFNSNYCGSEMDYALHRLVERRDNSVVVIKLDDVDSRKLPRELRKRSYIDYPQNVEKDHWERKLVNSLTTSNDL